MRCNIFEISIHIGWNRLETIDFFVRTELPPLEGVFYNGQIFDAYVFATDLIRSDKRPLGRSVGCADNARGQRVGDTQLAISQV